jgi:ABC-type Fe3+-siderophore transport system permease subunit
MTAPVTNGSVTAYCGPVSFIGVDVSHLCRSLFRT